MALGPTTRMLQLEADEDAKVVYQGGKRRVCMIPLPRQYASAPLLLIDSVRWAMLLDPSGKRLEALFFPIGTLGRTVLLGSQWGQWINERGELMRAISIPELLMQWDFPVSIHDTRQTLGLEFPVNIFNREVFTQNALTSFRDGPFIHSIELQYAYPLGGFRLGRIKVEHERTSRIDNCTELTGFPIILAEVPPLPAKPAPPKPAPPVAEPKPPEPARAQTPPREEPPKPAPKTTPPPQPPPPPREAVPPKPVVPPLTPAVGSAPKFPSATAPQAPPRPMPHTEQLEVGEMLTVISTEGDPERRWRMIEANLVQGRYERSYPLISRYHDLIGERAALWPSARLKAAFTSLPGTVLIGMMTGWAVNQVLAIAEENPESTKIMEWLREREIERVMKLNLAQEPTTAESARKVLGMDAHYDDAMVRKVWRTLLGFMNADHGRSEERAIHRKKDEIAKILQVARNLLMKQS